MSRLLSLLLLLLLVSPAMADELTIERLFDGGSLDGVVPRALKISPDSSRVTFLRAKADNQNRLDLWEYNRADDSMRLLVDADTLQPDGETLSAEEQARRERTRTAGLSGIVDYQWSPDGKRLLFPLAGKLYLYDLHAEPAQALRLLDTGGDFIDPQISPKGGYVSYVQAQNLWLIDLADGSKRQLTQDGGGSVHNAEAEFVAQEEMDRNHGYWWAPDDSLIAFERYDEAKVPLVKRFEVQAEHTDVIEQRYPAAGAANVAVQLGLVSPAGGEPRWIDLGSEADIYLVRVQWLPDAKRLSYQRMARNQQRLDLRLVDVDSLKQQTLLSETSATWINLNDDLTFLKQSDAFVWGSERTGFHQLYLYGLNGKLQHALSSGEWNVDRLLAVDEKAGLVYLESNKDAAAQRQIYSVPLDGSAPAKPVRLSSTDGTHRGEFAADASFYIDTFSDLRVPPQVSLRRAGGEFMAWIEHNPLDDTHPYAAFQSRQIIPEFGSIKAIDGQRLDYRLYKPAGFDAEQKYPVMVFYYGGPTAQKVVREWGDHYNQYMAQQGFVVFTLDNRGMARRGRQFSDPIYQLLGAVEVEDQLAGIRWLKTQPWVAADRVGVFGWSYGGYLTSMLLAKASDEIAAGVAVAPVTDWALYDTFYTERYLGRPQDNPAGYIRSATFAWLDGLHSPLLLMHGMADDNVLFSHSTKLMAELQQRGTPFQLMTYPGGKHGLSTPAMKTHAYNGISSFLRSQLMRPAAVAPALVDAPEESIDAAEAPAQ